MNNTQVYTLVYVFVKSAKQRLTRHINPRNSLCRLGTQLGWRISSQLLRRFSPPQARAFGLSDFKTKVDVFFRFQEAMLTTLTAAVVLPTKDNKFHLCVCNVGDSLAYVYSKVGNLNYW
jgi:hypothetical protein